MAIDGRRVNLYKATLVELPLKRYCPVKTLLKIRTGTRKKGKMTKSDWLMRFRRCRSLDTLETVYEHLKYKGDLKEEFAITSAYDHRKAELTVGKLFDRVPAHIWKLVE